MGNCQGVKKQLRDIARFLFGKPKVSGEEARLRTLMDFSIAAPYALDPENLSGAIGLLDRFGWDAEKAARHIRNETALSFDDAIREKGDDPFNMEGCDPVPGPSV